MKIKVESVSVKREKDGKPWIYTVTTIDGTEYDTFDELKEGEEYEGDVKENAPYTPNFKLKKEGGGKKGFTKNYDFEKRRVALECATALLAAGKIDIDHLTETREKFFNYLNQ